MYCMYGLRLLLTQIHSLLLPKLSLAYEKLYTHNSNVVAIYSSEIGVDVRPMHTRGAVWTRHCR